MKRILLLIIVMILTSSISITSAATTLQPNLMTQMKKQEQINKKNTISSKLREQARLRKEAKDRVEARKYQRHIAQNTMIIPVTPTLQPNLQLSLKRPPEITPIITIIQSSNAPSPQNVDMNRVRSTWLGWYNDVRQAQGLGSYSYDSRLNSTAYDWNIEFSNGKGLNLHTRNLGDGYYNFSIIDDWFIARGVDPIVINRAKHTENVGYGYYSCRSSDCTDALIRSIRSTFNFFMSEKGQAYDLHYRSIVQPYFTKIGLSIITVPSENRYYLVVHYITK